MNLSKINLDPEGQRFDNFLIEEDDFVAGFDFESAGLTPGEWELPQIVLGVYEDNDGELYVLGADFNGLSTISKIVVGGDADFDEDGDVDGANFLTWQRGFLINRGATLADGDANESRSVNADDLAVWLQQYGENSGALTTTVPEPTSLALISGGFGLLLRGSRRTR